MQRVFLVAVGIALIVALSIIYYRWKVTKPQSSHQVPDKTYLKLRELVFNADRDRRSTLPKSVPSPDNVWAVVMDWGTQGIVVTVLVVSDGSASIYYSPGGGSLGGGPAHESIRKAAANAISVASRHISQLRKVETHPIPTRDEQVYFYVLTESGVYFAEGSQNDLANNIHPLSDLGNAMQIVISEYRLTEPQT